MKFSAYILSVTVFFAVDVVWLGIMTPLVYRPALAEVISQSPRLLPAAVFYAIFAIGIVALVVKPAYQLKLSLPRAVANGALFGSLAYGTYELTNYATISMWPLHIVVLDVLWGGVITGLVTAIVYRYVSRTPNADT